MSDIIASTYQIIKRLGAGGGGIVYLAYHMRLGKKVVLKADRRPPSTRLEKLRREVDVLKELNHTYIPQVYDFFQDGDITYTVIDFVEGESLDKPLKRGIRFSQPQVIKWAKQILEALNYLHSPIHGTPPRGFVHSDVKPANLMLTPSEDICLIDFNIALALGEDMAIGCSPGYASPEHYGLDYSSGGDTETADHVTADMDEETVTQRAAEELPMYEETITAPPPEEMDRLSPAKENLAQENQYPPSVTLFSPQKSVSSSKRSVVPDVRSDIYSVGATLYHLLSGNRPAKDAKDVVPLKGPEYSSEIVRIITKAMNPNPDLRYQTAEEMLSDFVNLRENDPRTKRLKRINKIAYASLTALLVVGIGSTFIGLKRMQTTEQWLKLSEYAQNALSEGDTDAAVDYALQALPTSSGLLQPKMETSVQRVLTEALGVYDLSDGYKTYQTFELPSEPLYIALSPEGQTAACIYAYCLVIFDTETMETLAALPVEESALSEVEYLDENTVLYAGSEGLTAYSISEETVLWTGDPATAMCISGDKTCVAAVYKDETYAVVYDASAGSEIFKIDFEKKCQQVTTNDTFANPNDNLFAISGDGRMLAVSFADGSLAIYDVSTEEQTILILEKNSGYTHFEGGFYQNYFAFSASSSQESAFAIINTDTLEQTGGFLSDSPFSVQTDENGIYVQQDNILVNIDPETGDQAALVTTSKDITCYAVCDGTSLIASSSEFMFFDETAVLMSSAVNEYTCNFLQIAGSVALVGSMDSPVIRVLTYEDRSDAEVLTYDASYEHSEARISADGTTVMLFAYNQFRLYTVSGELIAEVDLPNAEQIYDQQFVRDEDGSRLEVIYYDGTIAAYSAEDGALLCETNGDPPDNSLNEVFETDLFRIEAPLHGTPQVYSLATGKLVCELDEDAFLTYVTQVGDYMITQYITGDGYCYGQLLNENCEVLAELPYLCDIMDNVLYFDYPNGNVRTSRIYDISELIQLAQKQKGATTK